MTDTKIDSIAQSDSAIANSGFVPGMASFATNDFNGIDSCLIHMAKMIKGQNGLFDRDDWSGNRNPNPRLHWGDNIYGLHLNDLTIIRDQLLRMRNDVDEWREWAIEAQNDQEKDRKELECYQEPKVESQSESESESELKSKIESESISDQMNGHIYKALSCLLDQDGQCPSEYFDSVTALLKNNDICDAHYGEYLIGVAKQQIGIPEHCCIDCNYSLTEAEFDSGKGRILFSEGNGIEAGEYRCGVCDKRCNDPQGTFPNEISDSDNEPESESGKFIPGIASFNPGDFNGIDSCLIHITRMRDGSASNFGGSYYSDDDMTILRDQLRHMQHHVDDWMDAAYFDTSRKNLEFVVPPKKSTLNYENWKADQEKGIINFENYGAINDFARQVINIVKERKRYPVDHNADLTLNDWGDNIRGLSFDDLNYLLFSLRVMQNYVDDYEETQKYIFENYEREELQEDDSDSH